VIENGRIVEDGAPAELLARQGYYSRMYQRQLAAAAQP
jgi:ABC-type multidrug transport system fused ATPase/permease subunit